MDLTPRHPLDSNIRKCWPFRCLRSLAFQMFKPVICQKNTTSLKSYCHISFDLIICALSPCPPGPCTQRHYISILLAKQNYDWRRKGSAVSFCVWVPLHSITPQEEPGSKGRRSPNDTFLNTSLCLTSANVLVCKQNYCFVWVLKWEVWAGRCRCTAQPQVAPRQCRHKQRPTHFLF